MGLEATLIVADNSEYMLNGDYGFGRNASRWTAQEDAIKQLFNVKLNSNPESTVGLMTSGGKGPEVLVTPTQEFGRIATAIHNVRLQGESDILSAIQVAQLALKHRQNKNQRQRIIVFVGSPLERLSSDELVKCAKKLKKNNVACDVVSFGEEQENEEKLRSFVDAVNSSDNSHLVSIPAGTGLLGDVISQSGMLAEDGVGPSGGEGAGGEGGEGGAGGEGGNFAVDPNLDPELAMALRMSLEEEQARQAAAQRSEGGSTASATTEAKPSSETLATSLPPDLAATAASGPAAAPAGVNQPDTTTVSTGPSDSIKTEEQDETMGVEDIDTGETGGDDEDADLAMALALSRGDGDGGEEEDVEMGDAGQQEGGDGDEGMTEDEAIARAIEMSMKDQSGQK